MFGFNQKTGIKSQILSGCTGVADTRSSSYPGNLTKFFPSLWSSLPQTHTIGIRYSKPGAITHHWFSRAAVFFCQHCHSMKVRTRNSETEGEKIKGKVCRRKERLFNYSVNPIFLSAQLQACSEDGWAQVQLVPESSCDFHLGTIQQQIDFSGQSLLHLLWLERESERPTVFSSTSDAIVPNPCLSLCWCIIKERGII